MFIYTCFGQVLKGKTNLASSESEFDEATWSEGCKDSAKTRRREEETLTAGVGRTRALRSQQSDVNDDQFIMTTGTRGTRGNWKPA